jgi:hypothetical protein
MILSAGGEKGSERVRERERGVEEEVGDTAHPLSISYASSGKVSVLKSGEFRTNSPLDTVFPVESSVAFSF